MFHYADMSGFFFYVYVTYMSIVIGILTSSALIVNNPNINAKMPVKIVAQPNFYKSI